jgi:hypothetical protein
MPLDTYADLFDDDLGDVPERLNDRVVGKCGHRSKTPRKKSAGNIL